MGLDTHPSETLPTLDWDSDALKFYEVVDGEVVENPPMGAMESILASLLQDLMGTIARSNGLGRVVTETLFCIDRARNLKCRPDLAFVSTARWPLRRPAPRTEAWDVVPDLAVEVVSKSNTADQIAMKIDEYFQAGVERCVGYLSWHDQDLRLRFADAGECAAARRRPRRRDAAPRFSCRVVRFVR